ncbi:hypothetical protein BACCIP111899_01130 [Bacillus rhizoplanae]|uniref:Uncharacterized protein n=1 Tax=Bacillus rhizoplanae TaxID=2880966 RepID=A0ABM8Y8I4_9BACI|nr:hypothetical protein BACCIP111899_01130 [Bacillus rhizoplanae]
MSVYNKLVCSRILEMIEDIRISMKKLLPLKKELLYIKPTVS